MKGTLAAETEILTQVLALKDNLYEFAQYAYPWGTPGTPFQHGLRAWQAEELKRIGDHTMEQAYRLEQGLPLKVYRAAWSSGRGPGKSAGFGMAAHWHVSTRIGAPVIVAANTETQMRTKTFPEFATWFGSAINSHWFVIESLKISPEPWLIDIVKKTREEGGLGIDPKYWYVAGQNWSADNPNAFAGAHNPYGMMVLFDEADGIVPGVWDVTEGFFTEVNPYRYWLAASQRRSNSGRFHDLFDDPKMGEGWRTRIISTRGMDGVDQVLVEEQIRKYGIDSDFVRKEILGLAPRTSEDQFIDWGSVRQAQQNTLVYDYGEALILGVDPAPRGRTAWRFRQGRNARDACGRDTYGHWTGKDNVEIAKAVLDLDSKYRPDFVCIDFGMGTGVIDILKRKRMNGRLIQVKFGDTAHAGKDSEWGSHAIELWAAVRDWLPGGQIERDDGEKGSLSHQLTNRGWKWGQREEGKKLLEDKSDLKARGIESPDDADALACTFEVNPPRRDRDRIGGRTQIAEGVGTSMTD